MIKALLMDLDNTLLDFDKCEEYALIPVLKKYGIEANEDNKKYYSKVNLSYWKKLEKKEITREQVITLRWEEFLSHFGLKGNGKEINKIYFDCLKEGGYPLEGALEFLKAASKKYKIYIVSNGMKEVQDNRIKVSGIRPYLDKIYISQELDMVKPDKKFFDYVLNDINLNREECLVIGDSLTSDIQGAINSSIPYILFDRYDKNRDFNGPRCTKLDDLMNVINNL